MQRRAARSAARSTGARDPRSHWRKALAVAASLALAILLVALPAGAVPSSPLVDSGPAVESTIPATSATDVAVDADVTINFTEPAAFSLSCGSSGTHDLSPSASPAISVSLDPNGVFTHGETCTVTVHAGAVSD